jgi:hypothetical protein
MSVPGVNFLNYLSISITSSLKVVRFEVFMVLTVTIFWDVTPCGSCKNRLSISLQHALNASYGYVVPSSPILVTLMMGALGSSETSVLTRATWRNISEDCIILFKGLLKYVC